MGIYTSDEAGWAGYHTNGYLHIGRARWAVCHTYGISISDGRDGLGCHTNVYLHIGRGGMGWCVTLMGIYTADGAGCAGLFLTCRDLYNVNRIVV